MDIIVAEKMPVHAPKLGSEITLAEMEKAEQDIIERLPDMNEQDVHEHREYIEPLIEFLRKKQMHLPALGALRRLEARLGQLTDDVGYHGNHGINNKVIREFRVLARALDGKCKITEDEWRQSRRALSRLIINRSKTEDDLPLADSVSGIKIKSPDGMTLSGMCREAEARGDSSEEMAASYNISGEAVAKIKTVVWLHDQEFLAAEDARVINHVYEEMNATNKILWSLVQPIREKAVGKGGMGSATLDERYEIRLGKFEHAFSVLMQACESSESVEIPYLTSDQADECVAELSVAIRQLSQLRTRIKEIHDDE